ncbi:30S ribosomal protein S16 [Candidatus Saccharibacteria bacterium]|nr:30S ribosomal protein S16 [Candidatus Saccharibacteria bacterium]
MLAIRLQRNGRKGAPLYRIVVQEAQRHPLSGRIVAQVGSYNPHTKATVLDKEKVQKYLVNGAQPSTRIVRILKAEGVKLPKWVDAMPRKTAKAKHADKLRKNQPKEAKDEAQVKPPVTEVEEAVVEPEVAPTEETPAAE